GANTRKKRGTGSMLRRRTARALCWTLEGFAVGVCETELESSSPVGDKLSGGKLYTATDVPKLSCVLSIYGGDMFRPPADQLLEERASAADAGAFPGASAPVDPPRLEGAPATE